MPNAAARTGSAGQTGRFEMHSSWDTAWEGHRGSSESPSTTTESDATVLIMRDYAITEALRASPDVEAIYVSPDEHGGLIVYSVVELATDAVYDAVAGAEDELADRLSNEQIECRVRERQGRPASAAVPVGSDPIWLR